MINRSPVTHRLKTWPEPFASVRSGEKLHEVRKADRDYKAGDTVVLEEWDPVKEIYTGQSAAFRIGHVSQPGTWGLPDQVCAFSLIELASESIEESAASPLARLHRYIAQKLKFTKKSLIVPAPKHVSKNEESATETRVAELEAAIKSALTWIESAHRPPAPETFPCGTMVRIRLHALADLHKVIHGEYAKSKRESNLFPSHDPLPDLQKEIQFLSSRLARTNIERGIIRDLILDTSYEYDVGTDADYSTELMDLVHAFVMAARKGDPLPAAPIDE